MTDTQYRQAQVVEEEDRPYPEAMLRRGLQPLDIEWSYGFGDDPPPQEDQPCQQC